MHVSLSAGKYVVAVSGGVDSVALLAMLMQQPGLELIVAHFDHGIRPNSADDAAFVRGLAEQYRLPFVTERAELGAQASEARAREVRYGFLRSTMQQTGALAIVTAHHQDDMLETAILNILRGTGRKGLSSLRSTPEIQRPLLANSKSEIESYATQHKLSWREDSTNRDEHYTRNYIRHRLLVRFDANARQQLLALIEQAQRRNREIDDLLNEFLMKYSSAEGLDRVWFAQLSHDVSREVLAEWLRQNNLADFDRYAVERLTVQAKVKPVGKRLDVLHGHHILITKQHLALGHSKR